MTGKGAILTKEESKKAREARHAAAQHAFHRLTDAIDNLAGLQHTIETGDDPTPEDRPENPTQPLAQFLEELTGNLEDATGRIHGLINDIRSLLF